MSDLPPKVEADQPSSPQTDGAGDGLDAALDESALHSAVADVAFAIAKLLQIVVAGARLQPAISEADGETRARVQPQRPTGSTPPTNDETSTALHATSPA